MHDKFADFGTIPQTLDLVRSPFPPLAAVVGAVAAAWVAAWISARRTSRIRPAEALVEAAVEAPLAKGRIVTGVLVLIGGAVILLVLSALHSEPAAMPVTYLVVIVITVALALLGPLVARAAPAVLGVPLRASRVAGYLAANNARANARRLAAVITPLALLVGMASTIIFVQTTLGHAAERQTHDGIVADHVITSAGPGVPGDAADRLREVPGVEAVTEMVHTTVRSPGLVKYQVQGVTPDGLSATLDPDVNAGSLDELDDSGVAVSQRVADDKGLAPGSRTDLVMGDGTPVSLTVVAVYERGLGFGDLTMSHDVVAGHIDNPLSDSVLVATQDGTDAGGLSGVVADFPGVHVTGRNDVADQAEGREQNTEVNYVAMGLILAFTTIASVNTLAMSTADRSREFALLRLVGTTRRQVLGMLNLESLTVAATAVVLGTVVSLLTLTAFAVGMTGSAAPAISPPTYLVIVGVATMLALVATAVPGRIMLRDNPAVTFGTQQ